MWEQSRRSSTLLFGIFYARLSAEGGIQVRVPRGLGVRISPAAMNYERTFFILSGIEDILPFFPTDTSFEFPVTKSSFVPVFVTSYANRTLALPISSMIVFTEILSSYFAGFIYLMYVSATTKKRPSFSSALQD